jgi:hypothetical protein
MKTAQHGGRRNGAGRHAVLTWEEWLEIGAECEGRFNAIWASNLQAAQDAYFAKSDYLSLIANVHQVPIPYRENWHSTCEAENHFDDVEGARKQMAGMDVASEESALRQLRFEAVRPYAVKSKIKADVAAWATGRYGKAISERLVQSCWDDIRSFKKQQDAEESQS